jgi:hypothetical protein
MPGFCPDTFPGTPGGQAETIRLLNQAMTAALTYLSSLHLRNLHAAFVLPAAIGRNRLIPTGDPAKQRANEPCIPQTHN